MSPAIFFLLLLISCSACSASSFSAHGRRILHQPYHPLSSDPPVSLPPASTADGNAPFFPSNGMPLVPPSPKTLASFPANISSVVLPRAQERKPVPSTLIGAAVAGVAAAAIVIVVSVLLVRRKRRNGSGLCEGKDHRSDSGSRLSYCNSAGGGGNLLVPKLQRPSQTSTEFLYLGTMVNLHGAIESRNMQNPTSSISTSNETPLKMDSPELRPLAPLHRQSFNLNCENTELNSELEEETDVFYSPKGSLGDRESSIGTGSASRRAFSAVEVENLEQSSSSSSSASSSPKMSVCLSISPQASLSPNSSMLKSHESLAVWTAPPPLQHQPHPPPVYVAHWVYARESDSPSPASSSSPERYSRRSIESSPGNSGIWDRCVKSPLRIVNGFESPAKLDSPSRNNGMGIESLARISFLDTESQVRTRQQRSPISAPPFSLPSEPPGSSQNRTPPPPPLPPLSKQLESPNSHTESSGKNEAMPKPKLKPLHWDKVRGRSEREMVWDQIESSSYKANEEMIETLFVLNSPNSKSNPQEKTRCQFLPSGSQENRVLNVTTEEVCGALIEGNVDALGIELLESLMKMAPSKEEERKLREYKDDSPFKLGTAEKFLKALLDMPFAFKRIHAMLYISKFDSEISYLKGSFEILEAACEELRSCKMFLKLLDAVLKTGNHMNVGTNRGDAHAFKLDTLLKLVDIKGADGNTSLLHFVVEEIITSEGVHFASLNQNGKKAFNDDTTHRRLGLQVVSSLSSELKNVRKAATMDSEVLHADVVKLSEGIFNVVEVVKLNEATVLDGSSTHKFSESMNRFLKMAEDEIIRLRAQESVAISLVKEITEYFHGNSTKEEAHPFRIFMVVRDFLVILDRVCNELGMINERTLVSSAHKFPVPVNPMMHPDGRFSQGTQLGYSDDSA
ncbi:unnamed protein product [Cuscuta campestris]|uniref:Formin-like protein n=1 Tax=Cuscuta campestris TaxID=132261 RepID=A0A484NHP3_9ASTE|nr:unnamed protein product [Cuscuta campestris]